MAAGTAASATSAVASMTLAELQQVELSTAGNSWGLAGANLASRGGIPSLEEVLTALAGRAHILLELKSLQPGLVRATAAVLSANGWLDRPSVPYHAGPGSGVTVFCQHLDQLAETAELAPSACRMLAVPQITAAAVRATTHTFEPTPRAPQSLNAIMFKDFVSLACPAASHSAVIIVQVVVSP